ncbi:MAG: alpha-amylase family glycosyl hydrolase [Terriglobales bacterium]
MTGGTDFELHLARAARDRHRFTAALRGWAAARDLAARMQVSPATLHALALIAAAMHAVLAGRRAPEAALDWFTRRCGAARLDAALAAGAEVFPPLAVYRGAESAGAWLAAHRAAALEQWLLRRLANLNPALSSLHELVDESPLARLAAYDEIAAGWPRCFASLPGLGVGGLNLFDFLRAPALAAPHSLAAQLAWIREHWGAFLAELLPEFDIGINLLREEELALARWLAGGGGPPAGDSSAAALPRYASTEAERFSPDLDWMPRVVLVAKIAHVWLAQLSRWYGRAIERLDQIPEQELDRLAARGFTALWLIGLWERSPASRRIKQLCGNPQAEASAYSIYDYAIAADLGGEAACADLRRRAARHGLRLASDLVTNHMGLDSPWVMEHPDWFLSRPDSPFPAYRFDGPDLSRDPRVEIKIEDRYYDRGDAAVVFRRRDRAGGETRYTYHGNDGTSFPWNDSAQLDYLNPAVREAMIQTILAVARRFPILRFDAAMTLAKRHYQRLWFPAPGTAGAIPSRAEFGMSAAEFDRAMPEEFWREVVDRVAAETPGVLLLAEAFWLMEGYFVRTLGMHRVYNSAFMNMLRDEENAHYRSVLMQTLAFDPEILKRYVNFMNNPDERTAVDQFGKGDKYFGICTLLATLPGLPMFGHGQFEGFAEKYGMDFRRPLRDEDPDAELLARHEREITPLLRRRALFAEVAEFSLFDCVTEADGVNEDVFAFTNRRGDERALVIYHNRFAQARGWLRLSAPRSERDAAVGGKRQARRTLSQALGLSGAAGHLVACRDVRHGLEYLHDAPALAERGLPVALEAYECRVLLEWREFLDDGARPWRRLLAELRGGVPSLLAALQALELEGVHAAWRQLLAPSRVEACARPNLSTAALRDLEAGYRCLEESVAGWAATAAGRAAGVTPRRPAGRAPLAFRRALHSLARLAKTAPALLPALDATPSPRPLAAWGARLAWCALASLAETFGPAASLFDALRLREPLAWALEALGQTGEARWRGAALVRASFAHPLPPPARPRRRAAPPAPSLPSWRGDSDFAWLIGLHDYQGVGFFVREPFEQVLPWLALPALVAAAPRWHAARSAAMAKQVEALAARARGQGYRAAALDDPVR